MEDNQWQPCLDDAPWWLDGALDPGALVDGDEGLLDPLSVEETLLAASLAGPGPAAQELLSSLARLPLSQDDWLTAVQLWEAQEAWLIGQKALAVLGFAGPEPVTLEGFRDDEALLMELALAVGCSEGFAYEQIASARLLSSTLSRTGDLLRAGKLSPYRTRLIVGELGHLHPDVARSVEARVIDTAAQIPTGLLRKNMTKHTKRLDRKAANERGVAELAEKTPGRRVEFDPDAGDGLMGMYAHLPPVEALAIRLALKAAAGSFRKADGRCQDEREADALMGMLLGFDPANPGHPVPPKVKVVLLIDLPTLLGLRDLDGELLGFDHLPAEVAREIAAQGSSWQRLVYDPVNGYLLDAGTEVHDMPALTAFISLRDRRDRFPGGTRTAPLDLDHGVPFKPKADSAPTGRKRRRKSEAVPPEPAQQAEPSGGAADDAFGTADIFAHSPSDEVAGAETADDAEVALVEPVPPVVRAESGTSIKVATAMADCDHPLASDPTTDAAVVTSSPRATVKVRDVDRKDVPARTDVAADAFTDGTTAAGEATEGGRTSADNLAALSRRHHRAKTFLGYSYRHLGLGVLEWTTPLGRVYRTYPHDYRPEGGDVGASDDDPPPG